MRHPHVSPRSAPNLALCTSFSSLLWFLGVNFYGVSLSPRLPSSVDVDDKTLLVEPPSSAHDEAVGPHRTVARRARGLRLWPS